MTNSTTILLVDDNPDDARPTKMALRRTPARLHVAADAGEALEYLFSPGAARGSSRSSGLGFSSASSHNRRAS